MVNENLPITVLMAAYNGEKHISLAIESILQQTFVDFEFLIIDDGSTDNTASIISSYADPRIRYIRNKKNINLCKTLMKGVELSRGEFIARMDADDISNPKRLERQIQYMRLRPNLNLLGTNVRWIDETGSVVRHPRLICNPVEIQWNMFFRNCFNHPSVMIRRAALTTARLNYGVLPEVASRGNLIELLGVGDEDYMLFGLLSLYGEVENINERLLDYRVHNKSLTAVFREQQGLQTKRISHVLRETFLGNFECRFPIAPKDEVLQISSVAKKLSKMNSNFIWKKRLSFLSEVQCAFVTHSDRGLIFRSIICLKLMSSQMFVSGDLPILFRYLIGGGSWDKLKRLMQVVKS